MHPEKRGEVTLVDELYVELRRIADAYMLNQPAGHTLQPTALVHEALLKLFPADRRWENEQHFLAAAAQAMRHLLIDRARRRRIRPSNRQLPEEDSPIEGVLLAYEDRSVGLIELDEALKRLEAFDSQMARAVELRFFAGLGIAETALQLGLPQRTFERRWAATRTWLYAELT